MSASWESGATWDQVPAGRAHRAWQPPRGAPASGHLGRLGVRAPAAVSWCAAAMVSSLPVRRDGPRRAGPGP